MKPFFITFTCVIVLFTTLKSFGQDKLAYEARDQTLQLGLGLGATFSVGTVTVPPIQAHYEYGLNEEISIGGILGYSSSKETYHDAVIGNNYNITMTTRTIHYSYLLIGGRANYHFETGEKFDPYGGATLGYNKVGFDDHGGTIGSYKSSTVLYGAQIGANYYFTPRIGAWSEIGYGLGYLNLGLTFKL